MPPSHLSDSELAGYRKRTLAAAELLRVDEHLTSCADCRDRIFESGLLAAQARALRNQFIEHLDYDEIVACAEGTPEASVGAHVAECALCRAEVDDLRVFRMQLAQPQVEPVRREPIVMPVRRARWKKPVWLAAAAGLLVVAGMAVWSLQRPAAAPAPEIAQQPVQPREPALTPEQQQAVQLAMASHKLERASVLNRLAAKRGVLLGAPAEAKTFEILAPVGTTTVNDRPVFQWQAMNGASSYVVAVFDENFNKVAESPAVTVPEWQPEEPLVRGVVFNWQVSARVGGRTVRAPVPPAPEARFELVSAETAGEIEKARRLHAGNHLLLAVLYARAGALDDAAKEAVAISDAGLARDLRQSIEEIRKR